MPVQVVEGQQVHGGVFSGFAGFSGFGGLGGFASANVTLTWSDSDCAPEMTTFAEAGFGDAKGAVSTTPTATAAINSWTTQVRSHFRISHPPCFSIVSQRASQIRSEHGSVEW
jgi:hypothetical protein